MKLKFILFLLLSFLFVNCQQNENKELKEIKKNDYTISYNSNLKLDESGKSGTAFLLLTEKKDINDDFIENINLIIQNLDTLNLDLNKLIKISESQINEYDKAKLIESVRIKNGANEFHKFVFEGNFTGRELKFLQYHFVKNNKAYILTFSAEPNEFESYKKEMETVMKSFKLK